MLRDLHEEMANKLAESCRRVRRKGLNEGKRESWSHFETLEHKHISSVEYDCWTDVAGKKNVANELAKTRTNCKWNRELGPKLRTRGRHFLKYQRHC